MIKNIFFLFITVFINAQTHYSIVEGVVLDDNKNPINNAVVDIKDNSYQYTIKTNKDGYFSKKVYDIKDDFYIKITASDYNKIEQKVVYNKEKYIFYLSSKYREIEEVVIKKGVVHKGDSTIYNADFYASKRENKVIDLLKKLPNIDVSRNGKIMMNGKEISKVLVENEVFFTGSSALAINSLPANSVEKFEFIENYNGNSILGGDGDKTILNISLKEEKKKLIFGDIILNGNSSDRYDVGGNLFYYAPKTKINYISSLNNINKSIFTIEDYMAFNGGSERLLRDPMSFMNSINRSDLLELLTPNEKYEKSQFLNAVNISQNVLNDKFKITIFNINDNNQYREINSKVIKLTDKKLSFFERKENSNDYTNNKNNTFSAGLSNINTEKIDFQYQFSVKNANIDVLQNKNIFLLKDIDSYDSKSKIKNIQLNQTVDVSYKLSHNHSQGWMMSMSYFDNNSQKKTTSDKKKIFP